MAILAISTLHALIAPARVLLVSSILHQLDVGKPACLMNGTACLEPVRRSCKR